MKTPQSIVEAQVDHLLKVVEKYQKEHCEIILERAGGQAKKIIEGAYSNVHERTRRSVEEVRSQSLQALKMAEASLQTQIRLARHKLDEAFLEQAWLKLRDALFLRWNDKRMRNQWINEIIRQANVSLVSREWTLECPDTLTDEECNTLKGQLDSLNLDAVNMKTGEGINAGLRICAGGACIDGSVDGLLRQRERIEEMFLASIYSKQMPDAQKKPKSVIENE
jgi:vacuolar-type H+-ATPase subunit E/Vma4